MVIEYPIRLQVKLVPVGNPWTKISVGNFNQTQQLNKPAEFDFEFVGHGVCCLTIEHFNKQPVDPDTAVIIENISFFGISDPKFVWAGIYVPDYPEPWASDQKNQLPTEIPAQNYLGWNGVYTLNFSVPVFTWMHQIQNLGWIYQ